ncbi:SIR2 family protein [Flavobacterium sinopsychrotolerans]|uniref:SIR2-like domain-containing protein n=1 Tax=Flavobacterium sinopsychrotolerans TaxID=604089 RepID=A0A1H8MB75_9FLAO|nr:SIR2 family protein [Flavobacterium sinopsychrotolerans]SEO14553.1 SIR2-like domain-containing protein [Flavobacterium sinopsychrotolerans]
MKKLLIITGAGASLEFGMPSVKMIDDLLEEWALSILPLKSDNQKSLYSWVKEELTNYVSQNPNNRLENIINFENLLYTIQNLYSISKDEHWKHFNNRLKPFIELLDFPEVISFRKEKKADSSDFHFLHTYLIDKLLEHFRIKCQSLLVDKKGEIELLQSFFNSLKEEFEIGFINLNYDNVILSALPDLSTSFNKVSGEFSREELYDSNWNFCYHLHGSVYFDMKGGKNTEMHKILWNNDLKSQFSQNSSGRNGNYTSEGLAHLNSNIIAGLDKTNQLLREPFGPYYMQLDKLIFEADSILFMGYGFNDLHLNKIFPFIRYDQNKKRKVVVIDWASDDEDGLNFRHDGWTFGISETIPFNSYEMGNGKSRSPQPISYFKRNKTLEKSYNPEYPLSIWYDGVLEACRNSEKIKDELR